MIEKIHSEIVFRGHSLSEVQEEFSHSRGVVARVRWRITDRNQQIVGYALDLKSAKAKVDAIVGK